MKSKTKKVVSFIPKPYRLEDKTQEDILKERKNRRKALLDKLLKRE